ncbi:hypothetical protein BDF21DRAFT_393675 [Thamnidium elegans]|nr:hypothetical protein BDF21DRAFT_393675 [Thamnidium elegans]
MMDLKGSGLYGKYCLTHSCTLAIHAVGLFNPFLYTGYPCSGRSLIADDSCKVGSCGCPHKRYLNMLFIVIHLMDLKGSGLYGKLASCVYTLRLFNPFLYIGYPCSGRSLIADDSCKVGSCGCPHKLDGLHAYLSASAKNYLTLRDIVLEKNKSDYIFNNPFLFIKEFAYKTTQDENRRLLKKKTEGHSK